MLSMNDEERLTAPQSALDESSSPVSPTGESALGTLRVSELAEPCLRELNAYRRGDSSTDTYSVELLRCATMQGDQEAGLPCSSA